MIDVHFEDSSTKKFVISDETTVGELVQKIAQKMQITVDVESFALYESTIIDGNQVDKYLKPDELCPRLITPSRFLFKKRFFFEENVDPTVVHMEYIQIREDVLRGRYPITERQFLELAAIDLRVTFGNPDPSKHKAGFLTSSNLLNKFIPAPLLKYRKPAVWEKALLDEYQRVAFDPIATELEGKLRYLARLREWQGEIFGSTFYDALELVVIDKIVREQIPVLLGVNKVGIHTLRKDKGPEKNGIIPLTLTRTNSFQQILGWAMHQPTHTFLYTIPSDSEEGVRFTFDTSLAAEIPEVCQSYVQMIIRSGGADAGGSPGSEGEGEGDQRAGEEQASSSAERADGSGSSMEKTDDVEGSADLKKDA
ncbi:putative talin [Monocercomonoides exilis]|uniref:putative talin n=1 Tax=Monocercomonoides exilis TaxID=2049356 RepID=UPI0035594E59|nr:putative talin [Monocercomonoides exilis]|eukprot:MONOS_8457.1-p1 / transcript=MONOS_8457.1 / gene=MONOS_8457 / organism=Monocercomonoides_exilis_PA203 / gene_product=unspecified product / transcript_product=unspecified product / location=Mono_scaffold00319:34692-35980(-) / protein_length=366 / sequence_SO=supercontig / SO=protein_coding / is_pseudo=false